MSPRPNKSNPRMHPLLAVLLAALVVLPIAMLGATSNPERKLTYSQFVSAVGDGRVKLALRARRYPLLCPLASVRVSE